MCTEDRARIENGIKDDGLATAAILGNAEVVIESAGGATQVNKVALPLPHTVRMLICFQRKDK